MTSVRTLLYVGAGALILAIAPWPYEEYYTLLRFFICGICAFSAYVSLREHSALAFPFLMAGIVFNPIMKVQMDREIWILADLVVATGFFVVARLAPRLDAAKVVEFPLSGDAASNPQPAEVSS
jgi:hypothetical protein